MNVIFHTSTAIGATVLLTGTERLGNKPTVTQVIPTALSVFLLGIISHGVLDYIPHCYPLHSKIDVIGGTVMILSVLWFTNASYRLVMGLSFFGSLLPDLIDHTPELLNKHFNLEITVHNNIFPWHWPEYSGSIYDGACIVSTLNHLLLIFTLIFIAWIKRKDLQRIFTRI